MTETPIAAPRRVAWQAPLSAWAILLVAGSTWGATFSLAKVVTQTGAHPLGIALWQSVIGATILTVVEGSRRRRLPLDRRHLGFYLLCGLLGTAIPSTSYFYAAPHLAAGVMAITVALSPLLTFLGAALLGLDRLVPARLLGVVLGIVAVLLIALPKTSLPEPGTAIWVVVVLGAALCYATENVVIAELRPPRTQSLTLLWGMLLISSLALLPAVLATGSFVSLAWPWGTVEWTIAGMAAINVFSYWLFVYLVTATGPVFASQIAYVVTIFGVLWGLIIFEERHSAWIWGALAVMLAGLALVTPRGNQESGARNQEPEPPDS